MDLEGKVLRSNPAAERVFSCAEGAMRGRNIGELIPKVQKVAREHNMIMPREFILIMKQMLYFDRYAKLLAPDLNIFTDPRLVMSLMADIQKARASSE